MTEDELNNVYARIGKFVTGIDNVDILVAFNKKETEIMIKAGLEHIGTLLFYGDVCDAFKKKTETLFLAWKSPHSRGNDFVYDTGPTASHKNKNETQ